MQSVASERECGSLSAWWLSYAVLFLLLIVLSVGITRPWWFGPRPELQTYQAADLSDFEGIMTQAGAELMVYSQYQGMWILEDGNGREVSRIALGDKEAPRSGREN